MKSKKLIRLLSLALVVVMAMSMAIGCGKKEKSDAVDNTGTSNAVDSTIDWTHKGQTPAQILAGEIIRPVANIKWPISDKQITLKILKPLVMYDTEYGKTALMQDYEKKTGIKIEWNTPPAANFTDQYNLIMNSGTDLPDAIIAMPSADVERLGQQGILIPVNDLIDKNMPNLKSALAKYPSSRKVITSDEGKQYAFPYITQFVIANNIMMAREDWLKKLNLEPPQTIDDWYKVLKAFKEKDPNGNGKPDEWPFSGYGAGGTGMSIARSLCTAWGVFDGMYLADKLQPKDDKIHFGPIESKFREAMEWVRKIYSEGLIDPEIVTNDSKAFQAKALQGQIGAWRGQINGDMTVLNDSAKKAGDNNFAVREMPIIKGPYGDQVQPYLGSSATNNGMSLTRTNKYPKETAMWADYWYSDVGQTYVYGIEGLTYNKDDKGKITITDWINKNPDGKTMNEARGMISFGRSTWPTVFQPWDVTLGFFPDPITEESRIKYRKPELLMTALPEGMSFTLNESTRVKQLSTDIQTYVDESLTNFIIGKQPLNDSTWNAYLQKLKSMGVDEWIKIYNDSYERWKKR